MAPHEPYISGVVRALVAAGVLVARWDAERNEPLDAAIQLDVDGRGQDSLLWVFWDEECGWSHGQSHEGGDRGLAWLRGLDVDLLAAPEVVVYAVRRCVLGTEPSPTRSQQRVMDEDPDEQRRFVLDLVAAGGGR